MIPIGLVIFALYCFQRTGTSGIYTAHLHLLQGYSLQYASITEQVLVFNGYTVPESGTSTSGSSTVIWREFKHPMDCIVACWKYSLSSSSDAHLCRSVNVKSLSGERIRVIASKGHKNYGSVLCDFQPLATTNRNILTPDNSITYICGQNDTSFDDVFSTAATTSQSASYYHATNEEFLRSFFQCSLGAYSAFTPQSPQVAMDECAQLCQQYTSCLYYQYVPEQNKCYNCMEDFMGDYAEAGLLSAAGTVEAPLMLRRTFYEVLYPSDNCQNEVALSSNGNPYNIEIDITETSSEGSVTVILRRITAIQFCTNPSSGNIVAGFTIYINGVAQPTIGCGGDPVDTSNQFPLLEFSANEVILQWRLYYEGWLAGITISTNMNTYGPYGDTTDNTEELSGYDVKAIRGYQRDTDYFTEIELRQC